MGLRKTVHLRVQRHAVLLGAVVVDAQNLRVIVFYGGFQLLVAFFQALVTVPKHVVMAGQIMEHASRQRVLFGRTSAERQQCHCAK